MRSLASLVVGFHARAVVDLGDDGATRSGETDSIR